MIFLKCLAVHLFGHQDMSEWFCSYFRKYTSLCGQFSRVAAVVGILPGHCCFILQDEYLQACKLVTTI